MAGLFLVAAASAQNAADEARRAYFTGFDLDRDGWVSRDEYLAYLQRGFDALDLNADGVLDAGELPVAQRGQRITNRDSHRRAVLRAFERLDRDRNGWLDPVELTSPP
ncbi:hypothetical protein [Pseudomarimonas arenosa]|uniref:EF-hand domain-containing protein n=1 Tax=Pseudomarimonas arenosa TaxID=2774145 RepID=A0AAW3ZPB7_9GAMM|nr:hypothetical protein [Pseudomarimonas arenosa]MBD8528000.1 hypothetical protein [Pseudomarimonas arenosa]